MERLDGYVRHVTRYEGHLNAATLAVEHFKRVNERQVHKVRSHVLADTAHLVQRYVSHVDERNGRT